jgi:hypothetical protein
VYGIRPWEMDDLMLSELHGIADDIKQMNQQER